MSSLPGISMTKGKRDIDHLSKNMFAQNLEHKIIGKDSPGPGCYNDFVDSAWNQEKLNLTSSNYNGRRSTISFPKSKRQLSEVRVDNFLGPSSYQDLQKLDLYLNLNKKRVSIGKEARVYEPIRYGTNHSVLQIKGIY